MENVGLKWVYTVVLRRTWVQKVKVIILPSTQNSYTCMFKIVNISSKVIGPVETISCKASRDMINTFNIFSCSNNYSKGGGNKNMTKPSRSYGLYDLHAHIWWKPLKIFCSGINVPWHVALSTRLLQVCSTDDLGLILTFLFKARSNMGQCLK